MSSVNIGGIELGDGKPCFVVAEIGINHNGSVDLAKKLIDTAAECGCQAVKLQKRTVDIVYTPAEMAKAREVNPTFIENAVARSKKYGYSVLGHEAETRLHEDPTQTTNGDLKRLLEFGAAEYREIAEHCANRGMLWSVSPWDEPSVDFMEQFDLPFWKIGAPSLTDAGLLRKVGKTGKPVVLSTGMSTMEQIKKAVATLGNVPLILLHCVSTYPTKNEDVNLRVIKTLQDAFPGTPVGYSGHEHGTSVSVLAAGLGACMIERHITLDRTMPGSDHPASLEPTGFKLMVDRIRRGELAMGDGVKRVIPAEMATLDKLRRVKDF